MNDEQIEILSKQIIKALTPTIQLVAERMAVEGIRQINQPINPAERPITKRQFQQFINRGGVHFNGDDDEAFL